MLRSPDYTNNSTYGSAPELHQDDVSSHSNDQITIRSSKRRRCDCGAEVNESKIDLFIESLTTWKQETDTKLAGILDSMNDIKRQNSELLVSNAEIEKSIDYLSTKYDDISLQLNIYQSQTKACVERMSVVESRTEEIERFSRTSTLEIRNLPLRKSLPQDELVRIAVRILKELLIDLSPSDIYDIRSIPTKQDNRTILLTLNSVILKNKILKAFRDFNKSSSSDKLNSAVLGPEYPRQIIYMSENLTAHARRLFYLARDFAKSQNYKHCWTANGRILLRKEDNARLIVVSSEAQLNELSSKN